jgi:nucleoside-diphosphate-sugar epimerase
MRNAALPKRFVGVDALEEFLSRPSEALVADLARVPGDLMLLGVGGKMGPTLARMAKRAEPARRVIGVARFSQQGLREQLEAHGIECIACDLLERVALERLPRVPNVVFMAGHKFGAAGNPAVTWAMNTGVPFVAAETFLASRIVVFSTACVYPFVDVAGGGATEEELTTPPPGDYANSCVGRERAFEYAAQRWGTRVCLMRLEYAIDMRYGVLFDVASKVFAGQPVDVTMGHVNVIWQGEANEWALRLLARCAAPALAVNVSGPETVSIRSLAADFGRCFGKTPVYTGTEAPTAWLVNTQRAQRLLGPTAVPLAQMIDWIANWVARGGPSLGKPTHFEARDGKY